MTNDKQRKKESKGESKITAGPVHQASFWAIVPSTGKGVLAEMDAHRAVRPSCARRTCPCRLSARLSKKRGCASDSCAEAIKDRIRSICSCRYRSSCVKRDRVTVACSRIYGPHSRPKKKISEGEAERWYIASCREHRIMKIPDR